MYLDADYYSEEDASEVRVKTKVDNRHQNWAYIPIPYFIPSPLYNNVFFNPSQYVPPDAIAGSSNIADHQTAIPNPFLKDPDNRSPAVAQLEIPTVKTVYRGRLTRQALKQKGNKRGEEDGKDEEKDAVGGDGNSLITTEPEVKEDATQMLSSVEIKLPPPSPEPVITSSTALPTATTLKDNISATTESFEIGQSQYLNGTWTDNTANSNVNETSSYYRQYPQSFDPDQVSITTWYPVAVNREELPISAAFKPSSEYNEAQFKPIVGQFVSGLEPPVLPKYP